MTLCVEHIHKSFGAKHVLNDISFQADSGHALGLLGRNGAGKTTTIRILTDIFRADSGRVTLDGAPMDHTKVKIGYLPEERGLYPKIKVGEQMTYIGRLRGMDAKSAAKQARVLLEELEASAYWNQKLDSLSKGNQQKVQLAIAVLHNPDVVILDEPFSGLDPVNAKMLKELINQQVRLGKIVLFSSHQMPYVEEFCQHICILNHGEIVLDGQIKEIKKAYPRNRVAVTPEMPYATFMEAVSRDETWRRIVETADHHDGQVEITLRDAADKQRLFALLAERGTGIDAFNVIEPTLEDIFVEKAGDTQ